MEVTNLEILNRSSREQLEIDLKQFCENWIWRATECLVSAPDFEASPKWAAKRLNVSVEKVVEALEGLERLGHIKRIGSTFEKVADLVSVDSKQITKEQLITIHSRIAPQIISKLDSTAKFTTQFFLGNRELLEEFAPKFSALIDEMRDRGLQQRSSDVTAMELSFTVLTDRSGGAM